MKTPIRLLLLLLVPAIITGCSSSPGPDSVSSHKPQNPGVFPDCIACHTGVRDPSITNSTGTEGKHIAHGGINCTKCHLDYTGSATHMNGTLDTSNPVVRLVYFDSTNPSGQWSLDTGPQTGTCSSLACHGTDTLDWYGTAGWILPGCSVCHASIVGTRRQVLGPGGDFRRESHHVIDYNNRNSEIAATTDCLVCHDMGGHMSGILGLKDKDAAGQVIVYQPGNPSSLEPFCLSCHDSNGASTEAVPLTPFSSSNALGTVPNVAGIKIKESWEKQYGHRRKGLTCLGDGTPGTGCHGNYSSTTGVGTINAHGSDNVGLLANKLTLPIWSDVWDESRYKLCLDCHNNYPSLHTISQLAGVADGGNYAQLQPFYTQWPYSVGFMVTGFRDYLSYNYDRQYNLHLYHLLDAMSGWSYRGDPFGDSIPSCVSCHNVHGVDGQYYYLWDEWNFSIVNSLETEYGKVANGNFSGTQYPDFCAYNCHWDGNYRYPRSPFNEAKAVAGDTSGSLGLANGDTVVISFSDSTNRPNIDETNINSVLALSGGHSWTDSNKGGNAGQLTAAWSSASGKTNNILTITIFIANPGFGDPTIVVGDGISFDLTTITDFYGNPIRGKMTLKGSF